MAAMKPSRRINRKDPMRATYSRQKRRPKNGTLAMIVVYRHRQYNWRFSSIVEAICSTSISMLDMKSESLVLLFGGERAKGTLRRHFQRWRKWHVKSEQSFCWPNGCYSTKLLH